MRQHPQHDELLSIADAAVRLHLSTKTVRRYIAAGRLRAYRVGPSLLRVDLDDVDALLRPVATRRAALPRAQTRRPRSRPTAAVLAQALRLSPQEHWSLHVGGGHDGTVLETLPTA